MRPYIVRDGDHLTKLAHVFSFDADKIWADPKNADLKKARDPEILCAGDVLFIPEEERDSRKWAAATPGQSYSFKVTVPKISVVMKLVGPDGPLSGVTCKISGVPDVETATTEGDGTLTVVVPVSVSSLAVDVEVPRLRFVVEVGHMDPIAEISGVRKRLQNLRYLEESGDETPDLTFALAAFQAANDLEVTGVIDDATRSKLVDVHGH